MRQEEILDINNKLEVIINNISDLKSDNPNHIIFTNPDLLEYCSITNKTLQKWRDNGIIKYSKIGRIFYYRLSDVLEMLEDHSSEKLNRTIKRKI